MRRTFLTSLLVVLVLVALVLAAGCGGGSSSSTASSAPAVAADVSADQVVKDSEAAMAKVTSASFVADLALKVQGDPNQMTDPTQKALLSQGITLHAEGQSSNDPTAVNMSMSLGVTGQTLEFTMMTEGDQSWVQYQGTWYALDKKSAKSLDTQAQTGAVPTEQLKSLGLDPAEWGTTYEMVGAENLNGVPVYHIRATADPQKLADALLKAMEDPKLANKLGSSGAQLGQLKDSLQQNKQQAEQLRKSLKETTVDYWIGTEDKLMYKAQYVATLDTKGQQGMEGVDGMSMDATVSMSNFGDPVTVTPPANAQSINKLMEQMFGGMMGGAGTSF